MDYRPTQVSVPTEEKEGNPGSVRPSISGDGRFIAFESGVSNLVYGDTNGKPDIFVHL
jgi:Tol biopolymer transport system component